VAVVDGGSAGGDVFLAVCFGFGLAALAQRGAGAFDALDDAQFGGGQRWLGALEAGADPASAVSDVSG
jgi:hypothetical protein